MNVKPNPISTSQEPSRLTAFLFENHLINNARITRGTLRQKVTITASTIQLRTACSNSRTRHSHSACNIQSLTPRVRGCPAAFGNLQVSSLVRGVLVREVREAEVRERQLVFGSLIEGHRGGSLFLFVTTEGERLTIFAKSTDVVQLRAVFDIRSQKAESSFCPVVSEPEDSSAFYERFFPILGLLVRD